MNYQRIHDEIIQRARVRRLLSWGIYERHHVKPKCLGGGDEASNIVRLTPEEHYIIHQLLVKLNPGHSGLLFAALAMTSPGRGNGRVNNKLYGWLRRRFIADQTGKPRWSVEQRRLFGEQSKARNQGENHPMFGRHHREDTKALISAKKTGKTHSEEAKAKMRKPRRKRIVEPSNELLSL